MIYSALIERYAKKPKGRGKLWTPLDYLGIYNRDAFSDCVRYADEVGGGDKTLMHYLDNGDYGVYNLELISMIAEIVRKKVKKKDIEAEYSDAFYIDDPKTSDFGVYEVWYHYEGLGVSSMSVLATGHEHAEEYAEYALKEGTMFSHPCVIMETVKLCAAHTITVGAAKSWVKVNGITPMGLNIVIKLNRNFPRLPDDIKHTKDRCNGSVGRKTK